MPISPPLIIKAQQGDVAAAYRLCLEKKPLNLIELLFIVHPMGKMTTKQFDTCCDAFQTWQEGKREPSVK